MTNDSVEECLSEAIKVISLFKLIKVWLRLLQWGRKRINKVVGWAAPHLHWRHPNRGKGVHACRCE